MGGLAALWLQGCARAPTAFRPGIVFLSIDTLRADHVGAYGHPGGLTPALDRLAAQAHRFAWTFTPTPTTLPAHVGMLSGKMPWQLGVTQNEAVVPGGADLLPAVLAARGYATGGFTSAVLTAETGFARGFGAFDAPPKVRSCEETAARAIAWLKRAPSPFFLFVHFYEPHTPYDREGSLPPFQGFLPPGGEMASAAVEASKRAYAGAISRADVCAEELLGALHESAMAGSTLLVVTSDHGETLDEMLFTRRYAFDHGEFLSIHQISVPLLIKLPGQTRGRVHEGLASLVDITPTILDVLGEGSLPDAAGRTLLPAMQSLIGRRRQAEIVSRRRTFFEPNHDLLRGFAGSIVRWPWQAIIADAAPPELYNLERDPKGERNLAEAFGDRWESLARAFAGQMTLVPPTEALPQEDPAVLERLRALGYVR